MTKLSGEWAEAKNEKFDLIGSVILGTSLIAIMYGFSNLPQNLGILLILGGLVGITIFFKVEEKNESPVLDVSLFRNSFYLQ